MGGTGEKPPPWHPQVCSHAVLTPCTHHVHRRHGACRSATQVRLGQERVRAALPGLLQLAIGGTAVGTGLNSWRGEERSGSSDR